jgi:tetratricopeptide (TPR) repeat protein
MLRNLLKALFVIAALVSMSGCDPETMTKNKVPDFIKDLLTFGGPASSKQVEGLSTGLTITSPNPGQVFPADKNVTFHATLQKKDEQVPGPELKWQVVPEKGGKTEQVGLGLTASKRLRPGNYRAELQATLGEQQVVKKVDFRVSYMIAGKVTLHGGAGIAQADVQLIDEKQKKTIYKTQSRNDGAFTLELPAEEEYKVIVRKQGYLFTPTYREIKSPKDGPLDFTAQKGDITDISLTQAEDSQENLKSLCPSETLYLKCKIQLEEKPSSLQVFLVDTKNEERPISFEPKETGDLAQHTDPSGFTKLKLAAPSASAIGEPAESYIIKMKVRDDKQDTIVVQFPESVAVNYDQCFTAGLTRGVDEQLKGNTAEAIKAYSLMEDMFNSLSKVRPYMGIMDKALFNRGVANLKMGLDQKKEASGAAFLTKSIQDFSRYIKAHRGDGQAHLLRGAAYQGRGDFKEALADYDSSIPLLSQPALAYELRGQANLKLGTKKNILQAIDDFTMALSADPGDNSAREARKGATKIASKYQDAADDQKFDTSQISIQALKARLDFSKYVRK